MNKRQQAIVDSYNSSTKTQLRDAYASCSGEKYRAWENCLRVMADNNGHDMRILGASSFSFSCACKIEDDTKLLYFTKSGQEVIELEVEE